MSRSIVHLITGLTKAGAETMLYQILKYRSNEQLDYKVVSLGGGTHYYAKPMQDLGYTVIEFDFVRRPLSSFCQICHEIKGSDSIVCWMYHANFVGYLAAHKEHIKNVKWCIRHSDLNPKHNSKRTLLINRICALWSKKVTAILYNGERARINHEAIGYNKKRGIVVDNGCDCEEFKPDEFAVDSLRKELGISDKKKVVLSVTKDTPIKDIPCFVYALGKLREKEDIVAIMCGPGVDEDNKRLTAWCYEAGLVLGQNIILLGMRYDIPRLLAACDLYVLHSAGEAFPNALIQAMACGCLCVATDVGDVRRIMNDDRCIVDSGDFDGLARIVNEFLEIPSEVAYDMKKRNRDIVKEKYDIREIVKQYEEIFNS